MIYRIIVDFRKHTAIYRAVNLVVTERTWAHLQSIRLPASLMESLEKLKHKKFSSESRFLDALEKALGREYFHIVRDTIMIYTEKEFAQVHKVAIPSQDPQDQKMVGASFGWFAEIMNEHGLVAPRLKNRRARFYFTEKGWDEVGRFVVANANAKGHTVKVIRRKEPAASQIIYRDDLQVALLPRTPKRDIQS